MCSPMRTRRPPHIGKGFRFDQALNVESAQGGVERRGEGRHERVADGLDLVPVVRGKSLPNKFVVTLQRPRESVPRRFAMRV